MNYLQTLIEEAQEQKRNGLIQATVYVFFVGEKAPVAFSPAEFPRDTYGQQIQLFGLGRAVGMDNIGRDVEHIYGVFDGWPTEAQLVGPPVTSEEDPRRREVILIQEIDPLSDPTRQMAYTIEVKREGLTSPTSEADISPHHQSKTSLLRPLVRLFQMTNQCSGLIALLTHGKDSPSNPRGKIIDFGKTQGPFGMDRTYLRSFWAGFLTGPIPEEQMSQIIQQFAGATRTTK